MRFAIGDCEVDVIVDIDRFEMPITGLFPTAPLDALQTQRAALHPHFLDLDKGTALLALQSFLIRVDGRTILIDSCVGEHKQRPNRPEWHQRSSTGFLASLAAAGVAPEDIDVVFCTHLHADHVGWNTRLDNGRWVPTFPNARYLASRGEATYWGDRLSAHPQVNHGSFTDSVLPVLERGLMDLVDDGHEVARGMVVQPLAGHTPGQMGLSVDRGAPALFCGDAIHSPFQIFHPECPTALCVDPDLAISTRRALLEASAEDHRLLAPAHFRAGRTARIKRVRDGFEPVFEA